MTGFGRASHDSPRLAVRAEVRTVNHRYLALKLRLPPLLAVHEAEVEALARKRFARGTVHVVVEVQGAALAPRVSINPGAAALYLGQLRRLARDMSLPGEVDLGTLVSLPGVVEDGSRLEGALASRDLSRVLATVGRAMDAARLGREREGEKLARDLATRHRRVRGLLGKLARRVPGLVEGYRERLARRVEDLLAGRGVTLSAGDLAREVAIFAERSDVTEELTRLGSHLEEMKRLLDSGDDPGRALDFLLQEMHREVNTIGSKAADAQVAHQVVSLKAELEKMREQVQNLE